jgi:DNA-directed RNA polymerase subunit L
MSEESKQRGVSKNMYIVSKDEKGSLLNFTVKGLNVSYINALRRTILSDIKVLGFQGFPHEKCSINVTKNTTRLHNEILKQRLSCIPITGIDINDPFDNLLFEIDKTNDTNETIYVTTKDFKIKNNQTNKYLNESEVEKIFPADTITGDNIIIARLLPQISSEIPGETLTLSATIGIHTAGEDGVYNTVSCCTYSNTVDKIKQDDEWQKISSSLSEEEKKDINIKIKQSDWYNHHSKRLYIPNSFDFKIETIGTYTNNEIVEKSCDVLIEKFSKLNADVLDVEQFGKILQKYSKSTISNAYDLTLFNEDYTVGKVIEYILHDVYFLEKKTLSYVGFRKHHPHDSYSIIRAAFNEKIQLGEEYQTIAPILSDACQKAIEVYQHLKSDLV